MWKTRNDEQQLAKRRKYFLTYGAVAAASCYLAYRVYRSDSLAALQELRRRFSRSLDGYGKSLLLASDVANTIVEDLKEFLATDADEIPQSLRQLAKMARSADVVEATSRLAAAAVKGAVGCTSSSSQGSEGSVGKESKQTVLEQAVDVLSTERGLNLVNFAVSIACRSSIQAMVESSNSGSHGGKAIDPKQPSWWQQVVELGSTPQGEKLYQSCIGIFVREGMKIYMSSLEGVNPWEDFFGSLCQPERQQTVDRVTRMFVNELVITLLKRSRHGSRSEGKGSKSGATRQGMLSAAARNASAQALAVPPEGPAAEGIPLPQVADSMTAALRSSTAGHALVCEDAIASSHSSFSPYVAVAQQLMAPEVRGLLAVVVGTAAFEGVRSLVFAAREIATGVPGTSPLYHQHLTHGSRQYQQLTSRALGTLLLFVFMPVIIFLAGRRAASS